MKKSIFYVLFFAFPSAALAQSVEWNCLHLDPPSVTGGQWSELIVEESFYYSCGFNPALRLNISSAGYDFTIETYDFENTLSSFIGNWLVADAGDMSSEATTRHQGNYLNHAKIDHESGYSTYNLEGTAPTDYYLIFVVENVDDYNDKIADPRYAYGWAHIAVNGDMSLSLLESAMSLDGSPLVVGAIPEPSAGVLLLLGLAALSLRRRLPCFSRGGRMPPPSSPPRNPAFPI